MASSAKSAGFVCSCFFANNIFVRKYKFHVSYIDKSQFLEDYSKVLRSKGCVTEKQFADVLSEVENEVSRRQLLGSVSLDRVNQIADSYTPLHRDIYCLQENHLDPEFLSLVSAAKESTASVDTLLPKMNHLGDQVYTFPVFTKQFCQLMLEELDHIEQSDCPKGRPNTMNQFGVLLNEFNFNKGLLDPLRTQYLHPITSILYPTWGGHCLDSHKTFTVHYQPDQDRELTRHFDNAEVTLNVALGHDGFSGGDLYFLGMSGEDVDGAEESAPLRCVHRPGWGVLHRGQHVHGAEAVTEGRRCNLIMWMRSSSVRNVRCPMCGNAPELQHVPGLDDGFRQPSQPVVDVCQAL